MSTTTTATQGDAVKVHYKGTLNDGSQFDSSYDRGDPIAFTVGAGQMIQGFDDAVFGMTKGEVKNITLTPEEAYGDVNPDAYTELSKDTFPEDFEFTDGDKIPLQGPGGAHFIGTITEIRDADITVDMNHPMAGKDLNFEIELIEIGES
jgi:peptidylprolyl isomerase